MTRRERRALDPQVQQRREQHLAGSVLGNVVSGTGTQPKGGDSGGWGVGNPKAQPATGQQPAVNPFIIPKAAGLNVTSQTYPSNYYVEWNLSTWRAVCDQAIKMGYTSSYATLVSWVFECSPFVQSLFEQLGAAIDRVPFFYNDTKGNTLPDWSKELCDKAWQRELRKEVLFAFFWGFTGLNFDPVNNKVYKYPMQDIDPINRMLRQNTYSFYDGMMFESHDNLLFVQPSTAYEKFLGWMQPIARSFIYMNTNKNSWIGAGKRLAFPLMTVGYPQADSAIDPATGMDMNPYRIQAENTIANADPQKGLAYPYTIDSNGNIVKSLEIEFEKTGTSSTAHKIFSDFNDAEKNEIREMILGGTLTSSVGDSGSRALGEVQERKFDSVVSAKLEFIVAYLNDEYLPKIRKFYKNMPDGQFDINRAKQMPLEDIVKLSGVVVNNGKRLTTAFFEANGLAPEFIEDAPDPTSSLAPIDLSGDDDTSYEMATQKNRTLFGTKKKS